MLDHIGFTVSNFAEAKAFYTKALAPLGLAVTMEVTKEQTGGDEHAGFGRDRGSTIIPITMPLLSSTATAIISKRCAMCRGDASTGDRLNSRSALRLAR